MLKFTKNESNKGYTSICGRFSIHHPTQGYTEDGTWMIIDNNDPVFGLCEKCATKKGCINAAQAEADEG